MIYFSPTGEVPVDLDYVQLLSRWLHITAAVTAAGGAMFMKFALHPAVQTLPETVRGEVREAVRSRWAKIVMASITVLLITGLYNFVVILKTYELPKGTYHAIFGVKFLLAMAIFFLASVLVGRSEMAKKVRADAGKWLTALVAMILLLLLSSTTLRVLRDHAPKKGVAAAQPTTATTITTTTTNTATSTPAGS